MAEAAGSVPTFKLVLVGDGGTGKVRTPNFGRPFERSACDGGDPQGDRKPQDKRLTIDADHLRQAPLDWRVREEVHCDARCRGPPSRFYHGTFRTCLRATDGILTEGRTLDRFSLTSGTPPVRRSLAVCVMDTTSMASAVSSCSMSLLVLPTRTFPTGTVSQLYKLAKCLLTNTR